MIDRAVSHPRLLCAAALCMAVGWSPAARAQSDAKGDHSNGGAADDSMLSESIGVLQIATEGVSATAGEKLEESIEETLADVGFRVVRSSTVISKLAGSDYVAGCTFGPCVAEVGRATGLSRVLVARIQGAGQSYSVVVSLIDTKTGHIESQVAQSCPVCTVDEAISTAALAVVELITEPGTPANDIAYGQGQDDGNPSGPSRKTLKRAGWIMLAGGALAGATGAYLLANDEDRSGGLSAGAGVGLGLAGLVTLLLSR